MRARVKSQVRALADERGWPQLDVGGNPISSLILGALGGFIIGMGILAVLTRGDLEGILVLLGGGGGGLGLIILAVTVLGIAIWAFVSAKLKQVKAGSEAWGQWLASSTVSRGSPFFEARTAASTRLPMTLNGAASTGCPTIWLRAYSMRPGKPCASAALGRDNGVAESGPEVFRRRPAAWDREAGLGVEGLPPAAEEHADDVNWGPRDPR